MSKCFLVFLSIFSYYIVLAQTNVGIGTHTPHLNAALEIKSNNKGLLMPRLANNVRNNMTNVPKGMVVFDSSHNCLYYHDGSRWLPVSESNADSLLTDYSKIPQVTANMSGIALTSARSGLLYDNGGPGANYGNSRSDYYTVEKETSDDSTIGYKIIVEALELESPYDTLEIYSADDYPNKQLFTGTRTGTFFFINNGAALHFSFRSNAVNNAPGFRIRWSKLSTSLVATTPAPVYGWYFNHKKLAMRGGVNVANSWATDSVGIRSFSYGLQNKVTGEGAVAFGSGNMVSGFNSFAAGSNNRAEGLYSIAMGVGAIAGAGRGGNVAMGVNASALGENAFAFGFGSLASGNDAYAFGLSAKANGAGAIALGTFSIAGGNTSLAIGNRVIASGMTSAAIGSGAIASGLSAISIGSQTKAIGNFSFAAGDKAESRALNSIAIGSTAIASGNFAASLGNNTIASGVSSTAVGQSTTASGATAFAAGSLTNASGASATALGAGSNAIGPISLAAGENSLASGPNALALGAYNTSSGSGAVSIGAVNNSGGNRSVALGTTLVVNADYATALGTKITIPVAAAGSLGIGDLEFSNNVIDNTSLGNANEFVARFRGGYFFMSSGNAPGGNYSSRTGVKIGPGQNSWSAISDVRLKENFEPVNGEEVLDKISGMSMSTWNYKAQDPALFRHYGPMAQDFFNAFGKDKHGTIGCDTLINQQDFLGVSFVAIKALEKRTITCQSEIETLKSALEALRKSNEILLRKLDLLQNDQE